LFQKQFSKYLSMESENNYEARLDRIFAKGHLWQHRTFRTVLDPFSSEWNETTFDKKIEILEKVVQSGINLKFIIKDYKRCYIEQNRRDISIAVETALITLLQHKLKKVND
jgi:hypothetical protein